MEQINTKVKKWGNSFGITLPKRIIDKENITEGSEINITVQPKHKMTVGDLLEFSKKNCLPKLKKSTDEIMGEVDRDLWDH